MDFKRLNNMTGKDPVLNRRIASIFLNEFESFLNVFSTLPTLVDLDQLQFSLHKIRPSLVIFELDHMVKQYENYVEAKKMGETIRPDDNSFSTLIRQTEEQIEMVRAFLNGLS